MKREGISMRRNCCGPNRRGQPCGWVAVVLGMLILLGLILPEGFWWIVCAAALICGGLAILR